MHLASFLRTTWLQVSSWLVSAALAGGIAVWIPMELSGRMLSGN